MPSCVPGFHSWTATSLRPAGLTEREVEVVRLIAAGLSNREISEELFTSQNTVIRHVSHIFSKTGCANRADATLCAVRTGLVDGQTQLER